MKEKDTTNELLLEARRTTHAVRAIARFVLLIVTYQVFAVAAIALGVGIASAGGEGGAIFFTVIGVLISVIGLFHALTAGHNELGLSDREQYLPAPDALPAESEPTPPAQEILPGVCDCSKWVRWGNTDTKDGVRYCLHCDRGVAK